MSCACVCGFNRGEEKKKVDKHEEEKTDLFYALPREDLQKKVPRQFLRFFPNT